jgi:hypothetical protein
LTCLKVHKSIYLHIYIFLIISYPDTKFDVFMSPIIINFDLYNLNFIVFFFEIFNVLCLLFIASTSLFKPSR